MFPTSGIHSYADARRLARRRLPWMVFDYIDGAAGEGHGEARNRQALNDICLRPRVLNNVENRSISKSIFGKTAQVPFGISPMGMCNLAGPGADMSFARAAARGTFPVGVSTAASTSLEEMAEHSEGNAWFQLYFSGNEEASYGLIDRAAAAGYETLILTVDVPEVGRRPRELRRGFKMPFTIGPMQALDFACHPHWSLRTLMHGKPELANFGGQFGEFDRTSSRAGADWLLLSKIRERWKGRLVVKGVLDVEDASRLWRNGVDGIYVSSHGGRQLDGIAPAIQSLADIRAAIGPEAVLLYDSGLRSGEDIVKAYAAGADFAFVGRPMSFAYAAQGDGGVRRMIEVLSKDIDVTLAQLGLTEVEKINASCLHDYP